jgi:broad specificity phosphatase PhoE
MQENAPSRRGKWGVAGNVLLWLVVICAPVALLVGAGDAKKEARTYPKQVLLIRHAERPPDTEKSAHLSAQGVKRAEALHELFEASPKRPEPFPRPDFLFATHNSSSSHRPMETITPLSKKLGLPINSHFHNKKGDEAGKKGMTALRDEIFGHKRYEGKTVLICWHHGTIRDLAVLLGARPPGKLSGKRFDRVWRITYDGSGKATFADLPQRLLPDDWPK